MLGSWNHVHGVGRAAADLDYFENTPQEREEVKGRPFLLKAPSLPADHGIPEQIHIAAQRAS